MRVFLDVSFMSSRKPSGRSADALQTYRPDHRGGRRSRRLCHRRRTRPGRRGRHRPPAGLPPLRRAHPVHQGPAARAHRADDAGGKGRPALRDARLRALRDRPRPGRCRREPEGDRGRQRRRTDRQVPRRRHHLLRLGAQHPRTPPDRRPLQRHPEGRHRPAGARTAADLHGPGTRHSGPDRRARDALPRGDGAGRGGLARRRPYGRPDRRRGAVCDGHPAGLCAGCGCERQRRQSGHRRTVLRSRPAGGGAAGRRGGAGLSGRRGRGLRQALPRARRHRHRQPHRAALHLSLIHRCV